MNEPNKLVVVGGSAGSLDVIFKMVEELPVDSGAAFVVIVHRKNDSESILTGLLSSKTKMTVREPEDKEAIHANCIYIAPPDYHLLMENRNSFSLDSSEKIHHSRPSIDVSFESAVEAFGSDVIGVLLSGANADGAAGLKKIKSAGGMTFVQNPETAEVSFMPQQALNWDATCEVVDGSEIGMRIQWLLKTETKK